jgi:O-antigen ligase
MSEIISLLLSLAPYLIVALFAAVILAASSRWLITNPQHWLFYAVLLFSLSATLAGGDGADGNLLKQLTWGALFALAGLHLIGVTSGRIQWPKSEDPPTFLVLLIAFAIASVAWSPQHMVSGKRVIQLIGVLLLAMVVARHALSGIGLRQQLLGPVLAFLGLGMLAAIAIPSFAFDGDHALRAISSHKNTWGQFSLLACLVLMFSISKQSKHQWIFAGLLMAAIGSLVLSKSTTSILAFILIVTFYLTYALVRSGVAGRLFIFAGATGLAGAVLIYTMINGELPFGWAYDAVFRLTEKSQTLTGRTYLWQLMANEIERHKWLGIGYGGFWMGLDGPSAGVINRLNWGPPSQAHSGYIDVFNELGLVGLGLLLLVLIAHMRKILALMLSDSHREATFHAAIFAAALFVNYAESSLMRTTHLWWVVLCASIVEVHLLAAKGGRTATRESSPSPLPSKQKFPLVLTGKCT